LDNNWLDSIRKQSDTTYEKKYRNSEFTVAEYLIDTKNSTVCQLMKDSLGKIRQIVIAKGNKRTFTAGYYRNGQLMADLPLDSNGAYNGMAKLYYANGRFKKEGKFVHGFYNGIWKNYDNTGVQVSSEFYDSDGQLIKTVRK
jgi:hypothetical protein